MKDFTRGDRVYVTDEGLAALRRIMREVTGVEPAPNHHGTVEVVREGCVLINFDDGGAAPYPIEEVEALGDAVSPCSDCGHDACACCDAFVRARRDDLLDVIAAVVALHTMVVSDEFDFSWCAACGPAAGGNPGDSIGWPCPTVRLLRGEPAT